jgi:uncharacterized protein YbjT (DUF2867 family)
LARPLILVTGATGTVGSALVQQLVEQGERVRLLTRDPERARKFEHSVEVIKADLGKPETLAPAFAGAEGLRIVQLSVGRAVRRQRLWRGEGGGRKAHRQAVGQAYQRRFLLGDRRREAHIESEQHLQSLGIPWTILRAGSFASNFLLFFDRERSAIALSVGDGKDSFIDPRDIAACAVKLLTTGGHDGRIYEITGSEHLGYAAWAGKLSRAAGKTVSFHNIPDETPRQGLLSMGVPSRIAKSFLIFFAAVRDGKIYPPTSAVADLLGRPPRSFDDWAKDHAAAFR